jgi:cytochrome c553
MFYSKMSKDDIRAIAAYVRSLKAVENKTNPRMLFVPVSVVIPQLPPVNPEENKKPDPSDKIKYGEYMTNASACFDCHTPMTNKGFDFFKAFSGGFTFKLTGFTVTSSNITPDSATGIGSWTEEAFVQKFKTNSSDAQVNTTPGKFNTIMPWSMYGKMKEKDLRAIYAYLRTVPALKKKVEKWPN